MGDHGPAQRLDSGADAVALTQLRVPDGADRRTRPAAAAANRAVLIGSCADATDVLAVMSRFFAEHGIFSGEASHFVDPETGRFFLRVGLDVAPAALEQLRQDFAPIASRLRMDWTIRDAAARTRTLIMVSRAQHCASELLYRSQAGQLPADVRAIVSNHEDAATLAHAHGVPFYHLPVTPQTKDRQEAQLEALIHDLSIDLVVLARYMRILPPRLCARLRGRCINIHHSFLPGFKGAKAYHQAHARGVKFIGATAHYVSAELDEGPIIEQVVERVDHSQTPDDFVRIGRDLERTAFVRAVQWHAEGRVVLNGERTVVFK
jgi:formyltetrahydrofolate deformylase